MALVLADRVRETTTTAGTGNIALGGAVTGFQSFSAAMALNDTTYYTIAGQGTNEWEVGIGTLTGATTLVRTTVLDSSNSNNLVSFSAGVKDVFITYPALEAVPKSFLDGAYESVSTNPSTNVYSSGSWVISSNISANETSNVGVVFSPDGVNMYTSGDTSDAIDQYTLSRAFDVTSITYLRTFSVSAQTTQPRGITFDPTGVFMYVVDDLNNRIIRYVLTTAWNISTAGTPTFFSVAGQTATPGHNIQFSPDGLLMFICTSGSTTIFTYSLSTAWVITSASLLRLNNFEADLRGFVWSSDGLQLFTLNGSGVISRRSPATAWNTSGIGGTGTINQQVTFSANRFPTATYGVASFSLYLNFAVTGINAGTRLFTVLPGPVGFLAEYIGQFELSAANDISLMLNPLFDITTATSRQIDIVPGPAPNYIGRFGVPPLDFLGMTKQLKITATTILVNNNSFIRNIGGQSFTLSPNDILQVTYVGGGVWDVTDIANTLKGNVFNLQNNAVTGLLAYNPTGSTFIPRTVEGVAAANGAGVVVGSGDGTANLTITNTGALAFNSRFNTQHLYSWWHPLNAIDGSGANSGWNRYGESFGSSPWSNIGATNAGTFFSTQKGGGFNGTDTPDNFYWDKALGTSTAANYTAAIGFPREANDPNCYLRRFYYYENRWYQREMIYLPENNFNTNARSTRSMSELVLALNYADPIDDTFADSNSFNYAIPFEGSATQVPVGVNVSGTFLVSGTTAAPTIISQAVVATTIVYIHIGGDRYRLTYWTTDGLVSNIIEGGGTATFTTVTFTAGTTFNYNYWAEGDVSSRCFVKVFFSNTATVNWTWLVGDDRGATQWRIFDASANRANNIGTIEYDGNAGGFDFPSTRTKRIWSTKSMALPLTTNTVARNFTIQAKFRVDNITTQDQNVFWIANSAAAANGIRVVVNEGSVDRRLSITLATTVPAAIVTALKCWQFNDVGEEIVVTFVWNPLDTTWPGRLYVNGYLMFKTASQPFSATTAWFNVGSSANGTANGFQGKFEYLTVVPECWGQYRPEGACIIDVEAGNAAWVAAANNGGADIGFSSRNNYYNGYLRNSSWGYGANIRSDNYWDAPPVNAAADTFTLSCVLTNGTDLVALANATAGFPRNPGLFLVTGTGIPTATHVYILNPTADGLVKYGEKAFVMRNYAGAVAATASGAQTITFVRCNGGAVNNGFLQMPGNAIFVAKQNALSTTLTTELAGVASAATANAAFPDFTFTAIADAVVDEFITTQNLAANNTAMRNLINMLSNGPKLPTITGTGITATSATIAPAYATGVEWDFGGTGLHRITLNRARNAAVTAGTTFTVRYVPSLSSGYLSWEAQGGNSAMSTDQSIELYGYSPDVWFASTTKPGKSIMATAGIGQWRYTRISPPGCAYDSGIFRATATTFARRMYLGYGCIGYLITYGTTGDFNQSTVNPVVSTIAWGASNGMNSDGFSLTVVVNTFYRVVILPFNPSISGDGTV